MPVYKRLSTWIATLGKKPMPWLIPSPMWDAHAKAHFPCNYNIGMWPTFWWSDSPTQVTPTNAKLRGSARLLWASVRQACGGERAWQLPGAVRCGSWHRAGISRWAEALCSSAQETASRVFNQTCSATCLWACLLGTELSAPTTTTTLTLPKTKLVSLVFQYYYQPSFCLLKTNLSSRACIYHPWWALATRNSICILLNSFGVAVTNPTYWVIHQEKIFISHSSGDWETIDQSTSKLDPGSRSGVFFRDEEH